MVNTQAFLSLAKHEPQRAIRTDFSPSEGENTLEALYSGVIGEGGRNTALTRLVGSLRGKRIPYTAGLEMASQWNNEHCSPPLDHRVVEEMVSRAWVDWEYDEDYKDATPQRATVAEQADGVLKILTGDEVLESDQKLNWTMRNILLEGGLHYLSGPPAGGKSWLALEMCRVITTGGKFFNTYDAVQGPCLYVDEEMGAGMTAHRMGLLGFRPAPNFYYLGKQGFHLGLSDHRQQLLDFAVDRGIKFMVFDTLRGCCPGLKENESEHVTRLRAWFGSFTRAGVTLLILHHTRKSTPGESDPGYERMAGSADFAGMADMAYAIDKVDGMTKFSAIKNRLLSEDEVASFHYEIKTSDGKLSLSVVDVKKRRGEIVEEMAKEVVGYLRDRGSAKATTVAAALGLTVQETTTALTWLHGRDYVTRDREGNYEWQKMF